MPTDTKVGLRPAPAERRAAPALRVLAVADDALMGEALVALLERTGRIQALRAGSLREARTVLVHGPVNAVLWEAAHADRDVLAEVDAVREQLRTPVCLVARSIDVEALREMYARRAEGLAVVLRRRDLDSAALFRVLVQLVTGRVVLSPLLLEQLMRDAPSTRDDALRRLSGSELAVLELVALGLRNLEIARRLGRSQKLVEKHISRTFAKLGLSPSNDAIDRRVTAVRMFMLATSTAQARPTLELAHAA